MKLVRTSAAAALAAYAAIAGGAHLASAEPMCEDTALTVQIPQPNPYDAVPDGSLPEPTGAGFTVTLRMVEGVNVADFDPHMSAHAAQAQGLGDPVSVVSDADAQAVFRHLPEGVYLVSVEAPDDAQYRKAYIDEFLVSVPLAGQCDAEVDAKVHYSPTPTPPSTPSTPPTPVEEPNRPRHSMPLTGAEVAGLGLVGLVLAGGGLALINHAKMRKDEQ